MVFLWFSYGFTTGILSAHLEERLQLFHQTDACSAVAGDVDAGQAAHAGELRGLLEELVLVSAGLSHGMPNVPSGVIKHGWLENEPLSSGDVPIQMPILKGFSIAMSDFQKVLMVKSPCFHEQIQSSTAPMKDKHQLPKCPGLWNSDYSEDDQQDSQKSCKNPCNLQIIYNYDWLVVDLHLWTIWK